MRKFNICASTFLASFLVSINLKQSLSLIFQIWSLNGLPRRCPLNEFNRNSICSRSLWEHPCLLSQLVFTIQDCWIAVAEVLLLILQWMEVWLTIPFFPRSLWSCWKKAIGTRWLYLDQMFFYLQKHLAVFPYIQKVARWNGLKPLFNWNKGNRKV